MTRAANILWTLIYHTESNAAFRWMWWLWICIAFMAVGGTFIGSLYIGGGALAAIYVALAPRRFLHFGSAERIVTLVIVLMIFTSVGSSLLNPEAGEGLRKNLFLLGILLTIPLMLMLPSFAQPHWRKRLLEAICAGGILAGVFAGCTLLFEASNRLEALAGNPLIFGHLCGVLAVTNFVLITCRRGVTRFLPAMGFAGATLAVALSGSRSPLFAELAICAATAIWLLLRNPNRRWGSKLLVLYTALVALTVVYVTLDYFEAFSIMRYRLTRLADVLAGDRTLGDDLSVRMRLDMLIAGAKAILDSPLVGYGRQNVMAAASAFHPGEPFTFTHLHNTFLTEAVASGIPGALAMAFYMASPIILTQRADRCVRGMALALVGFTVLGDSLNIGLPHDIKMAWFGAWVTVLNTLARTPTSAAPPPRLTLREEFRAYWRNIQPDTPIGRPNENPGQA